MPFTLSAFADEIDEMLDIQIEGIKRHGIDYIEARGIDGKNVSDYTPEEMKTVKKRLDEKNVKVSAIGSPIGKIGITDDFESHLEKFKNTLELARILETKYIRLFSFYIPDGEEPKKYRDEVLKRMDTFVKTAEGSGIILLHENEKGIYGDNAKRCFDILESIGSDILRATFDPANFIQCGETTYPYAYELLKDHIEYMHIKDAKESGEVMPAGDGKGHIKEILENLKNRGYNGFLSLEPHLGNFSGLAELEKNDTYKDLPKAGEKTFALAVNSLKNILKEI